MIDSLKAQRAPLLLLEIGDFMETDSVRAPLANPYILDRLEAEGPAVVLPGATELDRWDEFQGLIAGRRLAVVCSNVARRAGEQIAPLTGRSAVLTINGVRVGLLGVVGAAEFAALHDADARGLVLQDAAEAIRELVPALREQAELIVVMACVGDTQARALAGAVTGVDVFISGYESIACKWPFMVGQTIFDRTGLRGQYLSLIRLILSPTGRIVDWGGENLPLSGAVPVNAEVDARVVEIERQATRLKSGESRSSAGTGKERARFLGAEVCRRCHSATHEQWRGTPHARAFATLQHEGRESAAECQACHVTGWGEVGGFETAAETRDLRGVQCECCHGPGVLHARGGAAQPVSEGLCRRCHTPEWSPDWDFAAYAVRVRH